MNISVKNVPDPVYRVIKRQAKRNRRSLNAEVIRVLEKEADEAERLRKLRTMSKSFEQFRKSLPPMDDSAPLIRRERERH